MKKLATYDTIKKIVKYMKSNFIRTSDPIFRQPSTAYSVGDVVYVKGVGAKYYLLCTTAGTTGDGDITLPSPIAEKDTVTDGTVTWTIRKIGGGGGDGVPLGVIIAYSANGELPSGYLLCDGAAVSRTVYPDLFSVIGTTYGAGDGSTTFNVPDLTDKFIEGSATAGTVKAAGLPNITGMLQSRMVYPFDATEQGGAFYPGGSVSKNNGTSATGVTSDSRVGFDASRSNSIYGASDTVQPPALTCRYIIKYK